MVINFFKIAWRNLLKSKSLFLINTLGLTLGIASTLLIALFVSDELGYDQFNEKADRIVRVVIKGQMGGEIIKEAVSQAPVAPVLVDEFPEVEEGTRLRRMGYPLVVHNNDGHRENRFSYVDPNFFQIFSFPFIKGDPKTALTRPNTVVITEEQAHKFFGNANPIGKELELKEWEKSFTVTGVVQNIPQNSHLRFDMFASMLGWEHASANSWLESHYHSYLVLNQAANRTALEQKLEPLLNKYMGPQMKDAMGMSFEEFQEKGNALGMFLQPLTDIHLHSDFAELTNLAPGGNIKTVYSLGAIAIFILLVACINFMTLSTAAASRRSKEIGVKKVLGSQRNQLIKQFLVESFIMVLTGTLFAILLSLLALPLFNELTGKQLHVSQLINIQNTVFLVLFVFALSLIAGVYPAFVLSSFKPISALRNRSGNMGKTKNVRSALVVFQFSVAVSLIIATIVVKQQISFVLNKDVGYQKDNILVLKDTWKLGASEQAFKEELLKDPRVASISSSGFVPAGPTSDNITSIYPEDRSDELRRTVVYQVDEAYIPTMGMELVLGRNFSKDYNAEGTNLIINESSAKVLGFGSDAIDKTVTMSLDNNGTTRKYRIVGVVKDFHYSSLYQPVEPLIMVYEPNPGLLVRADAKDIGGLITSAETLWVKFKISEPFTYGLLDELYSEIYVRERKMGWVLQLFTILTIFIGCMGLFALATFSAEQRTKEIGIRKVLGATAAQMMTMLSKNFVKLVVISFAIAFPLGYYFMGLWLQDFAYRIQIQWWVFVLAGFFALGIAFLTISWQSLRVSRRSPVYALKNE
ncbi:ABC transporter permease [Flagellimonas allohymeniacidonis]|uniref:FtsX-like permease family protein n=1 Tax=Flagellimonas allohymeniacidonis TaxID=2517819 RepID=A0A4Q8QHL5_9FLAO|nr:ABC transporter permease [Allomuricauda hymeniacidonis]TAI47656.1 FtsX-like permease family protein [Allomuricauda hymeniacidonis]